ncbi:MAG: hypothetical protein QOJ89_4965, partial [bacterium]
MRRVLRARVILPAALGALLAVLATLALLAEPVASKSRSENKTGIRLRPVGRFHTPTFMTGIPGDSGRLAIVERPGTIRMVHNGVLVRRPFLDVSNRVGLGGERGLLSVAFPPDYQKSRLFYIYYTGLTGTL